MARIWMILTLVLALAASVFAQDGTYRLKPEDILTIQVYNEQQINTQVPIGRDGNISAPFVGTVRAEGKTTAELEAELKVLYARELKLRDPKVSITIFRYRAVRASVVGAVNRSGTYELRPGDTVVSLLGAGAGPLLDRANLKRATLRRYGSQELIPIDLDTLLKGDTSQNYVIEDGDELIVPEDTENRIMVQGAVNAPGQFIYRQGMRLADAISLARGEVVGRTKFSEVYVIRERPGMPGYYTRIKCNYVNYIRKGDGSQNVALQAGDTIFVSFTKNPSFAEIGTTLNTFFIFDQLSRNGLLGFRPFRF